MTDYEKLKKCFDEIGIEYEDYPKEPSIAVIDHIGEEVFEYCFDDDGKYIK